MYYDIVEAKYLGRHRIELVFENGRSGVVDLGRYIKMGGVFARFSDMDYFKRFFINKELGVLCWPDDVDIAPETIYHEATGEPLPSWARPDAGKPELAKKH